MKKNFFQRMLMPLEDLEAYYRLQRAEQNEENTPIRGIIWRKRTHAMIVYLLKIKRLLSRQKLTVVADRRRKNDMPVIYACTHIGRYDVEMALESIGKQCHIFMGDPGKVYKNADGLLLFLNSVLFADTAYRDDCHVAKQTCIRLLKQGGSLMIFPEGSWDITENQAVMPLYDGTAEWEIWNQFEPCKRSEISHDAAAQYLENIMKETENGYTVSEIIRTRYHIRAASREEAFGFMEKLIPRTENAFLFDKRNSGGLM